MSACRCGPGRGCGNSVNALLDAWLLTGRRHYLDRLMAVRIPVRITAHTPIWISGGVDDPIATTGLEGQVAANMRRTGFKQVRLEHFMGTHQLKRSELKLALRWFRELGGF